MGDILTQLETPQSGIVVSHYDHERDNRPKRKSYSWDLLKVLFANHNHADKPAAPRVSFTQYPKGATRGKASVEWITALVFDIDNGTPIDTIKDRLDALGLSYIIYSTTRHTKELPRYRIIIPLLAPVAPKDWLSFYQRANYHFCDDHADPNYGTDYSHTSNLPNCPPGADKFVITNDGKPLDPDLLPPLPKQSPQLPTDAPQSALTPPNTNSHAAYAAKVLSGELEKLGQATEGTRNIELNKRSFTLARWVGGGVFTYSEIQKELEKAALALGMKYDEDNILETIKSGMDKGIKKPKTIPEPTINHLSTHAKPIREISDATKIPAPTLTNDRDQPQYDGGVLVELLYPHWKTITDLSSQAAHAQRIKDNLGNDLCYNAFLGWVTYNGRHWERGDKNATAAAAMVAELSQVIRNEAATLYECAAKLTQAGRPKDAAAMSSAATKHARHAKQAETKNFTDGALHFAAGILAVDTSLFDQKPWIIGFQNGTWAHGEWREHRRDDYLLSLSPVKYDPDADQSEWLTVLARITGSDVDLSQTAQDIAGYIISGASHLRLMPWLYGPKGTGKSTFTELLKTVLNHLAAVIDPKLLQDTSARERLGASLWGRRLAVCSEAGNQKMDVELLKTLAGTDTLTVRFLFREAFDAPPRHVLLMVANDPPKMNAYDDALKDRVLALPFIHELNDGGEIQLTGGKRLEAVRQDPNSLLVRGFCAWAIAGLAQVHETEEIRKAKTVLDATRKFWQDTDQTTPFWETIPEEELQNGIGKTALRARYEDWCKSEGARPLGRNSFNDACKSHLLSEHALLIEGKRVKGWK
jgi:P4 family phage/plasmid primase-like protien